MAKKVVIISTSLRGGSNSDMAELKGIVAGGGMTDFNDAGNHKGIMQKAYELGKGL